MFNFQIHYTNLKEIFTWMQSNFWVLLFTERKIMFCRVICDWLVFTWSAECRLMWLDNIEIIHNCVLLFVYFLWCSKNAKTTSVHALCPCRVCLSLLLSAYLTILWNPSPAIVCGCCLQYHCWIDTSLRTIFLLMEYILAWLLTFGADFSDLIHNRNPCWLALSL